MAIVIVDDSVTSLVILKHLAKSQSKEPVHTYATPQAARDFLSGNSASLVVVDCEMPGMNGIEFISELRRLRHHSETKVLMVTHHHEHDVRQNALKAGANQFLTKPLNAEEFKMRLREMVNPNVMTDSVEVSD